MLSKWALTLLLAAPVIGSDGTPGTAQPGLTVHEWGTFTSVAGEDGGPQAWMPLATASDLPCFVFHLGQKNYKFLSQNDYKDPSNVATSTVRMETPVIYFYAPRPMTLSVHLDFPRGWITEWFPQSSRVAPQILLGAGQPLPQVGGGHIDWDSVEVRPDARLDMVHGTEPSHYYAARSTDAAPVFSQGDREKFLFYRGIANLDIPLRVTVAEDKVKLRNPSDTPLPLAVVFENRDGKIGYHMLRNLTGATDIPAPRLNGDLPQLKQDLAAALMASGLYEKEAHAMIETWGDSWFEDGMRVFYIAPRAMVDGDLPLNVQPKPSSLERTFVGRIEVLSPNMRQTLTTALSSGDTKTMAKYGRFLEPFAKQIPGGENASPAAKAFFAARYQAARKEFDEPGCVK